MPTCRNVWCVATVFVILVLLVAPSYSQSIDDEQVADANGVVNVIADAMAENCEDHEDPEDYIWDSSEVIQILLDGNTITASGAGATIDGNNVTITSGGTYSISGSLDDGQIIVDSENKKIVRLILNGARISSSTRAPVFIKNAKKTIIVLAENTENYVVDKRLYKVDDTEANEPNAVIFSKDNFTICGDGSLSVAGNFKDGISGKDGLIIAGGNIDVNAADDGIRGKDYLVIKNGHITVKAGDDGLKSDNESDATMGYISIETGVIDVNSGGDAITAQTDIMITDGQIVISSGGGSDNVIDESISAKGVKAVVNLIVDGGSFTIDSADDAIHCDGNMAINGGTFFISSGNDAVHADSTVEINGGDIDITKCYEGIEGQVITINNGDIYIISGDDGINAMESIYIEYGVIDITASGDAVTAGTDVIITDGQFTLSTGSSRNRRGDLLTSTKGIKGVVNVIIDGGDFIIDSDDDAVHSDGNVEINGGTFVISSGDDGIHANYDLLINGGDINIIESYEGMESADANITINDGNIHIVSSDDGINVAAGGDNFGGGGPGRGGQPPGQPPTPGQEPAAGNYYLYVNGGYIVIDADGDGIDSNGSVVMTDGVVIVNGPTSNMNGALDHASFKITGGFLLAVGSSGMAQAPSTISTQYSILLTFNTARSAGTLFHIQDSNGENIVSFLPTKMYTSVAFSSQELIRGSTYDVYYGGSSTGTAYDGLYQDGTYSPGTRYTRFTVSNIVTNVR